MLVPLKPTQIILPTRDFVTEFSSFDSSFFFYKGGIKGLIRDAIVMTPGLSVDEDDPGYSALLGNVFAEFDQYEMGCVDAGIYPKGLEDPDTVELVVGQVEEAAYEFLGRFFGNVQYEIMRTIDYLDKDLMVYARRF